MTTSKPQRENGDLFLTNGDIRPGEPWNVSVSHLAIRDGIVVALGAEAESLYSDYHPKDIVDLRCKTVLPGFIDSHIHLTSLGESLTQLSFSEDASVEEIQRAVEEEVRSREPGDWIIGGKWSRHTLSGFPDRHLLDAVAPENPVALHSKDLHSLLLNSQAIEELEIETKRDSEFSEYLPRDAEDSLTGILQEKAISLFDDKRPEPAPDWQRWYHREAAKYCHQYGITTVHSIESLIDWHNLKGFSSHNELGVRTGVLLPVEELEDVIAFREHSGKGDEWLWTIGIKIFTDGALGSCSAWMKQPYENSDKCGLPLTDLDTLTGQVRKAHENGLSVGIHAIGDAAVGMTIEALKANEPAEGTPFRDRIEHFQLVDPVDLASVPRQLRASVQPIHLLGDREPADRVWGNRARYAYAFKTFGEQGIPLAFGSDAPVEDANPWRAIQAAVERRENVEESRWYPGESIDLEPALSAYTIEGARTAYREDAIGALREGFFGDLVVLNRNPWETPTTELQDIAPVLTVLNGNIVFSDGTIA